jgi:hypothetical protein
MNNIEILIEKHRKFGLTQRGQADLFELLLRRLESIESKLGQQDVIPGAGFHQNLVQPSEAEMHYFVEVEGDWRCSECNMPYMDNIHFISTHKP